MASSKKRTATPDAQDPSAAFDPGAATSDSVPGSSRVEADSTGKEIDSLQKIDSVPVFPVPVLAEEIDSVPVFSGAAPRIRATPQQLRVFEAVARLGSFRRAADALHLAPPTVSIQMRELAAQIGEPLVDLDGRTLRLTPAGGALLRAARRMFDAWTELQDELAALRGLKRGRVTLAAVTTAEYFLPQLLGPFAARHPGIELSLWVENRDRVVRRLEERSVDLAVMMLPPESIELESAPFLVNELVVIAPADAAWPGAALARRPALALADLAALPWLMRERGSGTRRVAEQHFATHGFAPAIRMELGSNEAIKRAVAAGLGIAVVSRHVLTEDAGLAPGARDRVVVLPVEGFPLARQWRIVHPASLRLSTAAAALLDHLHVELRSHRGA